MIVKISNGFMIQQDRCGPDKTIYAKTSKETAEMVRAIIDATQDDDRPSSRTMTVEEIDNLLGVKRGGE